MASTTDRQVFYTSPLLTHEPGTQVFAVDDPDRTPLTVLRRIYGACRRREQVVCQAPDAEPIYRMPDRLVCVDEAQRPTRQQLDDSLRALFRATDEHSAKCPLCERTRVFWSTRQRCLIGTRMVEAVGDLNSYRGKVHPWLNGEHLDPSLAYADQRVTVRRPGQPDVTGRITKIRFPDGGGIEWHEPGEMGRALVALPDQKVPELLPIDQLYPQP
ncbi:hypothetical protein ACFU0X_10165 [Streptomyces cellulosae]|uniref:Uncharacterized protein n=1 Tax=Streptomyces cellulosae TaxID=1968 RepID=A0ABW6JG09_STRCE